MSSQAVETFKKMLIIVFFVCSAYARMLPKYADLDSEDHELLRAAYETPSYDHEEEEDDLHLGKIDLVKDGLWAIKAKIKELKAFDKALLANMLATKLQVKEMLKKHSHLDLVLDKKPVHHQAAPSYHQHYEAPQSSYGAPHHYEAPQSSYGAPQHYEAPYQPPYSPPQPLYTHDPYYGH